MSIDDWRWDALFLKEAFFNLPATPQSEFNVNFPLPEKNNNPQVDDHILKQFFADSLRMVRFSLGVLTIIMSIDAWAEVNFNGEAILLRIKQELATFATRFVSPGLEVQIEQKGFLTLCSVGIPYLARVATLLSDEEISLDCRKNVLSELMMPSSLLCAAGCSNSIAKALESLQAVKNMHAMLALIRGEIVEEFVKELVLLLRSKGVVSAVTEEIYQTHWVGLFQKIYGKQLGLVSPPFDNLWKMLRESPEFALLTAGFEARIYKKITVDNVISQIIRRLQLYDITQSPDYWKLQALFETELSLYGVDSEPVPLEQFATYDLDQQRLHVDFFSVNHYIFLSLYRRLAGKFFVNIDYQSKQLPSGHDFYWVSARSLRFAYVTHASVSKPYFVYLREVLQNARDAYQLCQEIFALLDVNAEMERNFISVAINFDGSSEPLLPDSIFELTRLLMTALQQCNRRPEKTMLVNFLLSFVIDHRTTILSDAQIALLVSMMDFTFNYLTDEEKIASCNFLLIHHQSVQSSFSLEKVSIKFHYLLLCCCIVSQNKAFMVALLTDFFLRRLIDHTSLNRSSSWEQEALAKVLFACFDKIYYSSKPSLLLAEMSNYFFYTDRSKLSLEEFLIQTEIEASKCNKDEEVLSSLLMGQYFFKPRFFYNAAVIDKYKQFFDTYWRYSPPLALRSQWLIPGVKLFWIADASLHVAHVCYEGSSEKQPLFSYLADSLANIASSRKQVDVLYDFFDRHPTNHFNEELLNAVQLQHFQSVLKTYAEKNKLVCTPLTTYYARFNMRLRRPAGDDIGVNEKIVLAAKMRKTLLQSSARFEFSFRDHSVLQALRQDTSLIAGGWNNMPWRYRQCTGGYIEVGRPITASVPLSSSFLPVPSSSLS